MTLDVSWLSWGLAFLPLAVLLLLMLAASWGAAEAGPVAWAAAVLVGFLIFQAPIEVLGFESARGVWSALTVLYVVWCSILLYEVSHEGRAFEPLRRGITHLLPHPLLQVLAFGWAFASFLQGVTGFGVPIAVCAPLLVGIGVRPLYAVAIPLIGHAWNNTFGTLAVAWLGLKEVTAMDPLLAAETALYAASFIWILNLLGGFLVCWLYDRWNGIRQGLPVILVMSLLQGGLTLGLSQWNDMLNGFIASSVAFVSIFLLGRLQMYRRPTPATSHIFTDDRRNEDAVQVPGSDSRAGSGYGGSEVGPQVTRAFSGADEGRATPVAAAAPTMSMHQAFIPYYALLVVTFGVLLIWPIRDALGAWSFQLVFPQTETGLGYIRNEAIARFAPLTHAGTFLLVAALIGYVAFRSKGTIESGGFGRIVARTVDKSIPSTIAVVSLIAMSNVLAGAGAVEVLAQGVAAATGDGYGFLAPLVGGLGAFMTTSNLASNLLFGTFQLSTAEATGLLASAILGAQTAGAAAGNMIAPGNVLLGTTTAGILGKEGEVLKITLPLFVMVAIIIGACVVLVA
jgi:lactate permease